MFSLFFLSSGHSQKKYVPTCHCPSYMYFNLVTLDWKFFFLPQLLVQEFCLRSALALDLYLLGIHFGNSHLTYSEWQWLHSELLPDIKILRNGSQTFLGFKNLNGIRYQFYTASCGICTASDLAALYMIQTKPFSSRTGNKEDPNSFLSCGGFTERDCI